MGRKITCGKTMLINLVDIPLGAFSGTVDGLVDFLLDNKLHGIETPSGVQNYIEDIEENFEILKKIREKIS